MEQVENEKPPVFQRWSKWYWLVITITILQILIYSVIAFSFS